MPMSLKVFLKSCLNRGEIEPQRWIMGTRYKSNPMKLPYQVSGIKTPQAVSPRVQKQLDTKQLGDSAVKEPDPLDMSEEAKAKRWFKCVAQIKDISELSQIPDEDFPSIMPMRKGVNRFVVSKRRTPLVRRLTSQQYRRNLPIVSSVPVKENDNS
ncbi:UNVERIFIED_CONTAM: Zinc finger protein VAR3, chloroplastic [Sesamum radiatum]|uniref:Zinc finger protein VAR3, chloroplastic n=1 Tax=Sesamum radiatum TaxID=300843 RepID=A0AAW2JWU4_SESRA